MFYLTENIPKKSSNSLKREWFPPLFLSPGRMNVAGYRLNFDCITRKIAPCCEPNLCHVWIMWLFFLSNCVTNYSITFLLCKSDFKQSFWPLYFTKLISRNFNVLSSPSQLHPLCNVGANNVYDETEHSVVY